MHTKEPWKIRHLRESVGTDDRMTAMCYPCGEKGECTPESEANARRIVDCVNALATIPDPAAFVEAARAMREALGSIAAKVGKMRADPEQIHILAELCEAKLAIEAFDAANKEPAQ